MTLPFGTRVTLNTDPTVIGVVVGTSSSTREGYAVSWPNGTRETRWREELTVVPPVVWPHWEVYYDGDIDGYIQAPTAQEAIRLYAAENDYLEPDLSVRVGHTAEQLLQFSEQPRERAEARAADLSRALSEIAALLGLPPDAEPKVVVEAFRRGALREAMRPPVEFTITTEGEARMIMESTFARTLRVVADLNPNGQDFVWASVNEDGTVQGMPRVLRQAPRHNDRGRPPRYVVGPDPALLVEGK